MATDENCIFCKIIAGKIPSRKFIETDKAFAFLGTSAVLTQTLGPPRLGTV